MNLSIVVVAVDEQIHVKVLHTLLYLNAVVNNSPISCNIHFCNNDPVERAKVFREVLNGSFEKTIWLEVDTHVSVEDIVNLLNDHKNEEFIVFPNIEKKINWEQFAELTKGEHENSEPVSMRAINTDIKYNLSNKNPPGKLIPITQSELRAFVMTNKKINKKLKNKFKNTKYFYNSKEHNGEFLSAPHNLCRMMREAGVQMKALVDTDVTRYFKHEHVGCIKDTFGASVEVKNNT